MGVTGMGPALSSASSCSSHCLGNVLILGLYPTCMHNPFQQHPSRRTPRFTILEWVIFQENHGTKTLRPPASQEDNKLSSLVGQEEVLTSLVMGCLWIFHNVIKNTHTAIPPREDKQPVPVMVAGEEEDDLSSPLVWQSSSEHQC